MVNGRNMINDTGGLFLVITEIITNTTAPTSTADNHKTIFI